MKKPKTSKKFWKIAVPVLLLLVLNIFLWFDNKAQIVETTVLSVIDGDTVEVSFEGQKHRVRLLYIDAPEMDQVKVVKGIMGESLIQLGEHSKKHLKQLVEHQQITLKVRGTDQYNRLLGVIYKGNENINYQMVYDGQAIIYQFSQFPGTYTKEQFLDALESAKKNKRGLWQYGNYQNPYYWRKKKKSTKRI